MPKTRKKPLWIVAVLAAAAVAVGAVVATGAINNAGEFEQTIDAECAPLVVLAFRGSGEGNLAPGELSNLGAPHHYGDSALVTNGWEGPTLERLFEELSQTVYKGEFRADSIPVVPIGPADESEELGYSAIDAVTEISSFDSALTFTGSSLLLSSTRGAEAATHLIHEYLEKSEGCGVSPKFAIVGYSQGAMAARHTAELNPESVLGVVNIGDPYQMPDAMGVRSGGASGNGLIRWKADDDQRSTLDSYYELEDFKSSICHTGDPVCEFSVWESLWKLATGTYGDHLDYYSDTYPKEAEEDAQVIARLGYEQQQRALAAAEKGDVVELCTNTSDAQDDVRLKSVSLSFTGVPTLFSVLSPELPGSCGLIIEFDLDGDGVYETSAPQGMVWTTFNEAGPHKIGVRVTDPDTGTVAESERTVDVAPRDDSVISVNPSDTEVSVTAPASVIRGERAAVTVRGGVPVAAMLHSLGSGGGSIALATSSASWTSGISIPVSVPAGPYLLMVAVENGTWGAAPTTVRDPATAALPPVDPPVTAPPTPPVSPPSSPPIAQPEPPEPPIVTPPIDPEPPINPDPPVEPDPEPTRTVSFVGTSMEDGQRIVAFFGTAFTPGVPVALQIEGTSIAASTTASAQGVLDVTMPAPPPGAHTLIVSDDFDELRLPFDVDEPPDTRIVDYVVTDVAPRKVRFTGSGFTPGAQLGFTREGDIVTITVNVDDQGEFEVEINATPYGNQAMRITGDGPMLRVPYTVAPPESPEPSGPRGVEYIGPGSQGGILFFGSGLTPNIRVYMQIEGDPRTYYIVTGDAGTFTANFATPPPGEYVLIVTDDIGEMRVPFTVAAPSA